MATLRESLLPVFQNVARKIPADLGLRTNVVKLRTRVWASGKIGVGAVTTTDITVTPAPKLTYNPDMTLVVVVTPANSAGGYTPAQVNPLPVAGSEFVWVVISPDGAEREYRVETFNQRRPFGYYLTLAPLDRKGPF
jgi:hypothetical protein